MNSKYEKIGDRYRVEDQLGQGAVGTVYRCYDPVMDNIVAVKVLNQNTTDQELMRFQQEAKTTAKMDHPNVIKVLDLGESEGSAFLVLEFLQGKSLEALVKDNLLNDDEKLRIFRQIAEGLRYAHSMGILHRDIKPSNVMLMKDDTDNWLAKVCDFGLAKQNTEELYLTRTGTALGSPSYMSPESALGMEQDVRGDIYSMGCLMYEVLTGRLPYEGDTTLEIMVKRTEVPAPKLKEKTEKDFSEDTETIVSKCLQIDQDKRFQTMEELCMSLESLDSFYEIEYEEPVEEDEMTGELPFTIKASKWPIVISIICLVAIAGTLIVWHAQTTKLNLVPKDKPGKKGTDISTVKITDIKPQEKKEMIMGQEWTTLFGVASDKNLKVFENRKDLRYLKFVADDLPNGGTRYLKNVPLIAINLKQSVLSDITLKHLAEVETLESVNLSRAFGVSKEGVSYLTRLKNLKELILSEILVEDDWMEIFTKMNKLESLGFRRCKKLSGATLDQLASLPNFSNLNIAYSSFKPENFAKLSKLKKLVSLDATSIGIRDDDLKALLQLKLETLRISGDKLTAKSLTTLGKMHSLKFLVLGSSPLLTERNLRKLRKKLPRCTISGIFERKPKRK